MNEEKEINKKFILLVEDDPTLRPLLVELLNDLQFKVIVAADGDMALSLLKQLEEERNPIDLLLTDIGLPGVNGCDLAEAARVIWPSLAVLFITGYAHGIKVLPTDKNTQLIIKPFSLGTLVERVESLINQK